MHIDSLKNIAMNESIFYINLSNWPIMRDNKGENDKYSCGFNHKAKYLIRINPTLLSMTIGKKTSLITS